MTSRRHNMQAFALLLFVAVAGAMTDFKELSRSTTTLPISLRISTADPWARQVVQILLDDLGDFLTKIERFPLPKHWHDVRFCWGEKHLVELRLRVWTAVAHFVVVFGEAVKPLHLPSEILEE